jgi:hypothetical protein
VNHPSVRRKQIRKLLELLATRFFGAGEAQGDLRMEKLMQAAEVEAVLWTEIDALFLERVACVPSVSTTVQDAA